jgi:hypothetical protein
VNFSSIINALKLLKNFQHMSAEGKQVYIVRDMASMAARFASWDALRVSSATYVTE